MQIRCINCKMPISIGRQMVENALDIIEEDNLVYFDFRCPKCKKANKISKEQLLHAAPGWVYAAPKKEVKKKEVKKKTEEKKE